MLRVSRDTRHQLTVEDRECEIDRKAERVKSVDIVVIAKIAMFLDRSGVIKKKKFEKNAKLLIMASIF